MRAIQITLGLAAAGALVLLLVLAARGPSATSQASPSPTPTATRITTGPATSPSPTATVEATGTIEGRVSYPSDFRPELYVYAIDVNDEDHWYTVTVEGTSREEPGDDPEGDYTLDVAPGTYYVLAYETLTPRASAGLYSEAVPCGLTVACNDHTLIPVTVRAEDRRTGIDPTDWYYPMDHEYPDRPE